MQEIIYLLEKILVFISAPFIDLVNISITASWVVLAVVVIRFCLKKAPKWLSCALWGVVALRLVFPFSLESELSLIPSTQTINPSVIYNDSFEADMSFSAVDNTADSTVNSTVDNAVNGTVENTVGNTVNNTAGSTVNSLNEGADASADAGVEVAGIIAFVWLIGMFVMASYAFISFLRLKLKLRTAVKKEGNIYQSEYIGSMFVLGLFRPRIYLPYKTDEADIPLVIEHEKAHIKRFDHIIKPLGYLLLSVHWFNPLMWVAYILFCRDIEAACDEKVIKNLGEDVRKSYSTALLNASISRKSVAACPLAFGEVGVKERIKRVMNYKKPAFWVIVAGVAVCIIAAVCLLTNPKGSEKIDYTPKITDAFDQTISLSVIKNNKGKYLDGMMSFEAHKVLATKTSTDDNSDKTITVYIIALYEEYSVENGELVEKGGSMTPLALTYLIEKDISTSEESYVLKEYWEPGMGSEYVKDLEAKFPKDVNYDTQKYVEDLQADCKRQAIDYFGLDESNITEENTQEYTTVMLESDSDYELMVTLTKDEMVSRIDNDKFYENNGYHVYLYFVVSNTAQITIGSKNLQIGEALNSGIMSVDKLLQKAERDVKYGKARMEMLKDGGTKIYAYNEYTIIKRNTTDGNKDLIISSEVITVGNDGGLFSYAECVSNIAYVQEKLDSETETNDDINGVTADISPEAEPQLTGKVTSATDKVIYMELTSDQSGIQKGTPVTVRLGSMLSYAPKIDTSKLKKGDIVTIIYDGRVMETYPLQIDAYAVYKKDDTVFDTENIARITFYAYGGHGKGSDVPAENMAEITKWLSTFTVDKNKKLEGIAPPGTNTHNVEIEYLDGTIVKQGLDMISVDGVRYYLNHTDAPDCFREIISKTSFE